MDWKDQIRHQIKLNNEHLKGRIDSTFEEAVFDIISDLLGKVIEDIPDITSTITIDIIGFHI